MVDSEKAADFKLSDVVYGGTVLSSRYNKFHEIICMIKALDAIDERPWRKNIASIWCDSKACATYSVQCSGADNVINDIANELSVAFLKRTGGHNGIYVEGERVSGVDVDPRWAEDEMS